MANNRTFVYVSTKDIKPELKPSKSYVELNEGDQKTILFKDKELGGGKFGVTYLFVGENLKRAIKSEKPDTSFPEGKQFISGKPFKKESDKWLKLGEMSALAGDPHKKDQPHHLMMEYKEGDTLHDFKIKLPTLNLSLQQNFAIFLEILLKVQYLHKNKVIHRDLSTSNILINSESKNIIAHVIDLGHSSIEGTDPKYYNTKDHRFAPELRQKVPPISVHAHPSQDIYALGKIFRDIPVPDNLKPLVKKICEFMYCEKPSERLSLDDAIDCFKQLHDHCDNFSEAFAQCQRVRLP